MYKSQTIFYQWIIGNLNEQEVIKCVSDATSVTKEQASRLIFELKSHQNPIEGTLEIITLLRQKGFNLYAITDNNKDFVAYYREHSDKYIFINYFKDIASSAEIGVLKPNPKMYKYILERSKLNPNEADLIPEETLFIDDLEVNLIKARNLNINALQFINPYTLKADLLGLGIDLEH